MFELTVEREFAASHAIIIGGEREPVHEHRWRVRLVVAGPELDAEGLLCDFHLLESGLDEVLRNLDGRILNEVPPFDTVNPTAERVAEHIADETRRSLPPGVSLARVLVTEAPGCEACYRPEAT